MLTEIRQKKVVDLADLYETKTVPMGAGNQSTVQPLKLISYRTRVGLQSFIRGLANAVAPGGEADIKFILKIEGRPVYPYDGSLNQWCDPSKIEDLPERIEVGQGKLIEVECWNLSDASTGDDWIATARMIVDYEAL